MTGLRFRSTAYCVSTVGLDEARVRVSRIPSFSPQSPDRPRW